MRILHVFEAPLPVFPPHCEFSFWRVVFFSDRAGVGPLSMAPSMYHPLVTEGVLEIRRRYLRKEPRPRPPHWIHTKVREIREEIVSCERPNLTGRKKFDRSKQRGFDRRKKSPWLSSGQNLTLKGRLS